MARCYLPIVSGRLVAHEKNIGMNKKGSSGTRDPVPYAFQQYIVHVTVTGVAIDHRKPYIQLVVKNMHY